METSDDAEFRKNMLALGAADIQICRAKALRMKFDDGTQLILKDCDVLVAPVGHEWATPELERYCIQSGRAVHWVPGDRCLAHGAADKPCNTDIRTAKCQHTRLSVNHPFPSCEECGKDLR